MSIKIDFINKTNKTHITYIIISIIILFGIIYIWRNCNFNKNIEGFGQQFNINSDDLVTFYDLSNIKFGTSNSSSLTDKLDTYYYTKANGTSLDARLNGVFSAIDAKVNAMQTSASKSMLDNNNALETMITINKTNLETNITESISLLDSKNVANKNTLEDKITENTTDIDKNTQPLTIIAYYGITAPSGWQICNGEPLKAINDEYVYYKQGIQLKTPDLRGRSILGLNTDSPNIANLSKTELGNIGGEEKHKLSIDEMPAHKHPDKSNSVLLTVPYEDNDISLIPAYRYLDNSALSTVGNSGGSKSHNNIHPVFVLNYIIKQPKLGGTNYIVMPANFKNPDMNTNTINWIEIPYSLPIII